MSLFSRIFCMRPISCHLETICSILRICWKASKKWTNLSKCYLQVSEMKFWNMCLSRLSSSMKPSMVSDWRSRNSLGVYCLICRDLMMWLWSKETQHLISFSLPTELAKYQLLIIGNRKMKSLENSLKAFISANWQFWTNVKEQQRSEAQITAHSPK